MEFIHLPSVLFFNVWYSKPNHTGLISAVISIAARLTRANVPFIILSYVVDLFPTEIMV